MVSYRLHRDETVEAAVRRIATAQADRALDALADDDLDVHETAHQVRKRCKKVRALLRLVRPAAPDLYDAENAALRDAARRVADLRDTTAVLEACDDLATAFDVDTDAFDPVREALSTRRREAAEEAEAPLEAVADDLRAARERIPGWHLDVDGFDALAGGLAKTYGRAVDRLDDVAEDPRTPALHEWRKRVKYHRYHVRLLQDCWPATMKTRREVLHEQTDDLGDDHDLAVLRGRLRQDPDAYGGIEAVATVTALLDRRRAALQQRALARGRRLFAEPPDHLVERIGAYWEAWQHDASGPTLLATATVPPGR